MLDELCVGFIGAGTVGTALAAELSKTGYRVTMTADRNLTAAKGLASLVPGCRVTDDAQEIANGCGCVFVTTPDDTIEAVVKNVTWHAGQYVVHCSGAASLDIMESARLPGAGVGSFHPCQSFATVEQAIRNLRGSTFAIEAEPPLSEILQSMAEALGGTWIRLSRGDKPLYHAAAVFASNYLVTVVKVATDLFGHFGLSGQEAVDVLMPLLQGTVRNIETVGLPQCLTGPIARGDVTTIGKHVDALGQREPEALNLYRELARHTIPIARAKGTLSQEAADALARLLGEDHE